MIEDKDTLLDIACAAKRVAHTLRKSRRMPEGFLNMQLGLSNVIKCVQTTSGRARACLACAYLVARRYA
jgi:hypothetical protein